jgi:hypothetical protein
VSAQVSRQWRGPGDAGAAPATLVLPRQRGLGSRETDGCRPVRKRTDDGRRHLRRRAAHLGAAPVA